MGDGVMGCLLWAAELLLIADVISIPRNGLVVSSKGLARAPWRPSRPLEQHHTRLAPFGCFCFRRAVQSSSPIAAGND